MGSLFSGGDVSMGNNGGLDWNLSNVLKQNQSNQMGSNLAGQQQDYLNMMNQQAQGMGPSLATAQMQQAMDQSIANQNAALASNRNVSGGLGARLAAQQAADANTQAAQLSMQGRIQEQNNAQQNLGAALGQYRTQDITQQGVNNDFTKSLYQLGNQRDNAILQQQEEQAKRNQAGFQSMLGMVGGIGAGLATGGVLGSGGEKFMQGLMQYQNRGQQ